VRIVNRTTLGIAAALLAATALAAGCSNNVGGKATCAGCGTGAEPSIPTSRPSVSPPTTGPPPSTPVVPLPPPNGGGAPGSTLPPNAQGYVYLETKSGQTRCQISEAEVGCEAPFTNSPIQDGAHANGVNVTAGGTMRWILGNLGDIPVVTIDYQTYHAVGWTIAAATSGTRFTNDGTGHGMFVSVERVEAF
jgi:hypothetical protein